MTTNLTSANKNRHAKNVRAFFEKPDTMVMSRQNVKQRKRSRSVRQSSRLNVGLSKSKNEKSYLKKMSVTVSLLKKRKKGSGKKKRGFSKR